MSSFRVVSRKITRRFLHALYNTVDQSENRKLQTQPIPVNVRLPDQTVYFRKRGEEGLSLENSIPIILRYRLEDGVKIVNPPNVFRKPADLELRDAIIRSANEMFKRMTRGTIEEILSHEEDKKCRAQFDSGTACVVRFDFEQGNNDSELIVTCINIYLPETSHVTRKPSTQSTVHQNH